jgi:hypothetical protein
VSFQKLGIVRWTPLFFGALACLGLFVGARRWLGRYGGAAAVGLYCSSGAAMAFAWRDYMPTFTDASLVAAGCGLLLWAMLATEAGPKGRNRVGLAGFLALEAATFVRYTDIVVLGCAVATVIVAWRLQALVLPLRAVCWWLASVLAFGVGVAVFDTVAYGGPLTTGYQPGEVTFAVHAIGPNLRLMPAHLVQAMPMLVLGVISTVWIAGRWVSLGRDDGPTAATARRDGAVGICLGATWWAIWGLYSTYTWTVDPTSFTVQVVRFYLPALGPIALLGAWLVTRVPGRGRFTCLVATAVIVAFFLQGVVAFHAMYHAFDVPLNGV